MVKINKGNTVVTASGEIGVVVTASRFSNGAGEPIGHVFCVRMAKDPADVSIFVMDKCSLEQELYCVNHPEKKVSKILNKSGMVYESR